MKYIIMNVAARKEILEEQGSIETLQDFLGWVESGTKVRLKSKTFILEIQERYKIEDPIKYLLKLYYTEEKSLDEIIKSLSQSGIKCPSKATLHRWLFIQFGWIPRPNTQRTPVHNRQLADKTRVEIAEFERQVSSLIGGREQPRGFEVGEFEKKTYRIGKALYILKTLGGIDKNILYQLSVELGLSDAILAKSLNKELKRILGEHPELGIDFEDVKLYPQSINRWFRFNAEKIKAGE